jgi:hypothetical protein
MAAVPAPWDRYRAYLPRKVVTLRCQSFSGLANAGSRRAGRIALTRGGGRRDIERAKGSGGFWPVRGADADHFRTPARVQLWDVKRNIAACREAEFRGPGRTMRLRTMTLHRSSGIEPVELRGGAAAFYDSTTSITLGGGRLPSVDLYQLPEADEQLRSRTTAGFMEFKGGV